MSSKLFLTNSQISLNQDKHRKQNEKVKELKTENESCKSCINKISKGHMNYCIVKDKFIQLYNICHEHTKEKSNG